MKAESPKIYTAAEQRAAIHSTTTRKSYQKLIKDNFYEHRFGKWLKFCRSELRRNPQWAQNPEYFRLLGLSAKVAAQFGFPQIEGQLTRYNMHNWSEQSPISPRHQLAVTIYTAGYTLKKLEITDGIRDDLADRQLAAGVWGLYFYPSNGTVFYPRQIEELKTAAETRLERRLPINLPDRNLHTSLAAIPFTGDDAERMPQQEFERDIYPQVEKATQGLLELETLFT
jgi:hypothetical protein